MEKVQEGMQDVTEIYFFPHILDPVPLSFLFLFFLRGDIKIKLTETIFKQTVYGSYFPELKDSDVSIKSIINIFL